VNRWPGGQGGQHNRQNAKRRFVHFGFDLHIPSIGSPFSGSRPTHPDSDCEIQRVVAAECRGSGGEPDTPRFPVGGLFMALAAFGFAAFGPTVPESRAQVPIGLPPGTGRTCADTRGAG
jgi:hypothetical protein